jgi:hypothetical protein
VRVSSIQPETWVQNRDIAALLAGPDPALGDDYCYSQAHYDACVKKYGSLDTDQFDLYFMDSISAASRMSMAWCKQQPEAFTKNGEANTMGLYGLHGREMVAWFNQIQRARKKMVVFLCILDKQKDEYGRTEWGFQIDGAMAPNSLSGIVDIIACMHDVKIDEEVGEQRAFITNGTNPHKFPAGDRDGGCSLYEPPDLQALIEKLRPQLAKPSAIATAAAPAKEKTRRKAA